MANLNDPNVRIQVLISRDTRVRAVQRRALLLCRLSLRPRKTPTLKRLPRSRADAWVEAVKNPPPPVEPTDEQLTKRAISLQKDLDRIYAELPDLKQARIDELKGVVSDAKVIAK